MITTLYDFCEKRQRRRRVRESRFRSEFVSLNRRNLWRGAYLVAMSDLSNQNNAVKEVARWRESDKRHQRIPELPDDASFLPPFEMAHQSPLPAVLLQQYDSEYYSLGGGLFSFFLRLTRPLDVQFKCFVGLFPEVSRELAANVRIGARFLKKCAPLFHPLTLSP